MPRSSSSGVSLMLVPSFRTTRARWRSPEGPPPSIRSGDAGVCAELLEEARADVRRLGATVVDHVLDVVLGDRLRGQEDGRNLTVAGLVLSGAVGVGLLTLREGDRGIGERARLFLGGLVDRHALRAGEDVLQTLDRRVLARHRDLPVLPVLL